LGRQFATLPVDRVGCGVRQRERHVVVTVVRHGAHHDRLYAANEMSTKNFPAPEAFNTAP
jgi:hypothetical protein